MIGVRCRKSDKLSFVLNTYVVIGSEIKRFIVYFEKKKTIKFRSGDLM